MKTIEDALTGTTESINTVLGQLSKTYRAVSDAVDEAFSKLGQDVAGAQDSLTGLAEEVKFTTERFVKLRNNLEKLGDGLPAFMKDLKRAIEKMVVKMDTAIARQEGIYQSLLDGAEQIGQAAGAAEEIRAQIRETIQAASDAVGSLQEDYEQNVQRRLENLMKSYADTGTSVSGLLSQMDSAAGKIRALSGSASSGLEQISQVLSSSESLLSDAADKIKNFRVRLTEALASGDLQTVKKLLNSDPELIGSVISAPVKLDTVKMYPVDNYGSAMAPFYSVLAIWVGGMLMTTMLKVTVEKRRQRRMHQLKNYQLYFGRYILFLLVGLLQAGLICLGDLYFLEIQCVHPFYFLLAGWYSSVVFVNIIYTLAVSFGDIGKAAGVIIMVIQVAGSGGTFPIEMMPEFFQKLYQLMPFTHSMTAMRECIAGFYENTYWIEMGHLTLFLAASLLLGLVLRKPVIRLNEAFTEKLESTRLM